ncbi:hypothetical protein MY11210_004321 [Beauveria gryllotalpidicola]
MDFTVSEGNSLRLLAPFADMLNHSSEVKQCHAYDPTTGDLSILASKDYNAGDQVFIYYGPVPNNRLLRLYGFVLPENPHDSYDLVLQTSPMAPLYEQKERLWKLAGLDTVCTIPLTVNDPLPRSVLRYLRIQRLDESLLGAMTRQIATSTDEKISDDSETQILQFLIDAISAILESFSIPLDILTAQLSAGDVYPRGGNAWAAAQVSAGEQRILRGRALAIRDRRRPWWRAATAGPVRAMRKGGGGGGGGGGGCAAHGVRTVQGRPVLWARMPGETFQGA